jgi:hypothetical protein
MRGSFAFFGICLLGVAVPFVDDEDVLLAAVLPLSPSVLTRLLAFPFDDNDDNDDTGGDDEDEEEVSLLSVFDDEDCSFRLVGLALTTTTLSS